MAEPKRRGRPPKIMAHPTDRLAELTAREKTLAIRSTARHRYTLDLPLDLYEQLIETAEQWNTPLPEVVRAAIRKGLEHIKQFGSADANPFAYGKLTPPRQSDIDPTGYGWPPTSGQIWINPDHDKPVQFQAGPDLRAQPFVGSTPPTLVGLMPSGATISLGSDAPRGHRHYDEHPPYNDEPHARDVFEGADEVSPEG